MSNRLLAQIRATEARFQAREGDSGIDGGVLELMRESMAVDSSWRPAVKPDALFRRAQRLGLGDMASAILSEPALEVAGFDPMDDLLERILGPNDLIDVVFLLTGAQVARSVGRIVIRGAFGQTLGYGTGFMISPRLLMTNNHVLESTSAARNSRIQFNYFRQTGGDLTVPVEFGLQPEVFFITNEALDFTIVAVEPANDAGVLVRSRAWNPLIADIGLVIQGERVNIVQHPGGEPQQLAFRQNQIIDLLDEFVHYISDTERGASGSPVFNDQWELAALHHAGVPRRDEQKRILLKSGQPWNGGRTTADQIDWVANEGTRISRIVAHVNELRSQMTAEQRRLYEEAFLARPTLDEVAESAPSGGGLPVTVEPTVNSTIVQGPQIDANGVLTWHIPVRLQISVGDPVRATGIGTTRSLPQPAPAAPAPISPAVDQAELQAALEQVQVFAGLPYYDEAQDAQHRSDYYAGIEATVGQCVRFTQLRDLLKQTHENVLSYSKARLQFLYPWVDLHETAAGTRELRSIYSGRCFSSEEAIQADFEIAVRREVQMREALLAESSLGSERLQALLEELEAQMPFNCEHVVPQSWFGEKNPMKGDLHHLFACEPGCNSFRSNIAYFQFGPEDEVVREACGRRETDKFEPAAGKGAVARATLYFLIRYPGVVGDENRELQFERIPILLDWHREYPVTVYERHRNAAIFSIQGNRNPLIDFPEWADQIDFTLGFGGA